MAESLWTLEYGDNIPPLIYASQAPAHLGRCRDDGREVTAALWGHLCLCLEGEVWCGGSSVAALRSSSCTMLLGKMEFIFLPDGACDLAADGRGRAGVCV